MGVVSEGAIKEGGQLWTWYNAQQAYHNPMKKPLLQNIASTPNGYQFAYKGFVMEAPKGSETAAQFDEINEMAEAMRMKEPSKPRPWWKRWFESVKKFVVDVWKGGPAPSAKDKATVPLPAPARGEEVYTPRLPIAPPDASIQGPSRGLVSPAIAAPTPHSMAPSSMRAAPVAMRPVPAAPAPEDYSDGGSPRSSPSFTAAHESAVPPFPSPETVNAPVPAVATPSTEPAPKPRPANLLLQGIEQDEKGDITITYADGAKMVVPQAHPMHAKFSKNLASIQKEADARIEQALIEAEKHSPGPTVTVASPSVASPGPEIAPRGVANVETGNPGLEFGDNVTLDQWDRGPDPGFSKFRFSFKSTTPNAAQNLVNTPEEMAVLDQFMAQGGREKGLHAVEAVTAFHPGTTDVAGYKLIGLKMKDSDPKAPSLTIAEMQDALTRTDVNSPVEGTLTAPVQLASGRLQFYVSSPDGRSRPIMMGDAISIAVNDLVKESGGDMKASCFVYEDRLALSSLDYRKNGVLVRHTRTSLSKGEDATPIQANGDVEKKNVTVPPPDFTGGVGGLGEVGPDDSIPVDATPSGEDEEFSGNEPLLAAPASAEPKPSLLGEEGGRIKISLKGGSVSALSETQIAEVAAQMPDGVPPEVHDAVKTLAQHDTNPAKRDNVGFNSDSRSIGRHLASLTALTKEQAAQGALIVLLHQSQLDKEVVERVRFMQPRPSPKMEEAKTVPVSDAAQVQSERAAPASIQVQAEEAKPAAVEASSTEVAEPTITAGQPEKDPSTSATPATAKPVGPTEAQPSPETQTAAGPDAAPTITAGQPEKDPSTSATPATAKPVGPTEAQPSPQTQTAAGPDAAPPGADDEHKPKPKVTVPNFGVSKKVFAMSR
jgi:hypothetical protein